MPRYDRVIALVTVVVIGLGLVVLMDPAALDINLVIGGWELALPVTWFLSAAVVAVACAGADVLTHGLPLSGDGELVTLQWRGRRLELAPLHWIMPGLLVLGSVLFLRLFDNRAIIAGGVGVTGVLLFLTLFFQHHSADPRDKAHGLAVFGLDIMVYMVAFALYSAVYVNKLRSIFSATPVAIATALLVFHLLRGTGQKLQRLAVYSVVAGLILGEVMWALNYWAVTGLVGGVFMLLILYVVAGMMSSYLNGTLTRRVAGEFAVLSIAGFVLIIFSGFWIG